MADAAEDVSDMCRVRSTPNLSRAGRRSRLPKPAIRSARSFPFLRLQHAFSGKSNWEQILGKRMIRTSVSAVGRSAFPPRIPNRERCEQGVRR